MKSVIITIITLLFFSEINAITLPDRMYADSTHAPFYLGVASGDPMADRVIIWTHITTSNNSETVFWQVATDNAFSQIIASGDTTTDASKDFTVKVDITGLQANTTYFYRFFNTQNNYSATGRTKTAPTGDINELKFAIGSCSSIYSAYFNAYRKIAQRDDLNLVIHLGDYLYDFVDEDEEIRVPVPYPTEPTNLTDWRSLHKYYALDPDFRLARQQHPFAIIWDNHDFTFSTGISGQQAFMEFTPTRQVNDTVFNRIYRKLSYSNLADIILADALQFRDQDVIAPGENSMLGIEQFEWFMETLNNSTAQWKVVGTQKNFTRWKVAALAQLVNDPEGTLNKKSWDGFNLERLKIVETLRDSQINNVIFLSGDMHVSIAAEVAIDPIDSINYNAATGDGSYAVEFMPTSIGRGNFDERGFSATFLNVVYDVSNASNPHHRYLEVTEHGYVILHFKKDISLAQFWYQDILSVTEEERLGKQMTVMNNENKWKRYPNDNTSVEGVFKNKQQVKIFPNPVNDRLNIEITNEIKEPLKVSVFSLAGIWHGTLVIDNKQLPFEKNTTTISTEHLKKGVYILSVEGKDFYSGNMFLKN
jgi:alkaline phosphatase D